jgi:hypothetical protein
MAICKIYICTNIFHCKTHQSLHTLEFLFRKYAIWQTWSLPLKRKKVIGVKSFEVYFWLNEFANKAQVRTSLQWIHCALRHNVLLDKWQFRSKTNKSVFLVQEVNIIGHFKFWRGVIICFIYLIIPVISF